MEDSIFTKIIKGEIPASKIYEDEKTYAFLDNSPISEGHTLVVPKAQVEFIWDLEDEDYEALMSAVKKVGRRLREVTGKPFVSEVVVGTEVPHAHVHLLAFNNSSELNGIFGMDRTPVGSDELDAVAEELRF